MRGDIVGRSVVDLGTGNGVLAIAAKALGASRVIGIDADSKAVEVARRNAERAEVDVEWHVGDVRTFRESFDTILMNPPFGSQTRHADRPFFETALARGRVVYAFLNANSEAFVRALVKSLGGLITERIVYAFPVRRTFPFHREPSRNVDVVLYRIETAKG